MKFSKYDKIYKDLLKKISLGLLKSNDVLASTRDLAKTYQCHRFTIMKVCQDLASEGWLETSEKMKYKVSSKIPVTTASNINPKSSKKNISHLLKKIPEFDLEKTKYALEFWGGQPDLRLFPKDEFRKILSSAIKRARPEQLNYGYTDGLDPCLKEISNYLRKSRQLLNKDYIVTNGSQEALSIVFQSFLKPGDKIAIEKKGYPPAWRLFENLGAELIPIDVDAEGLNTQDLKSKIEKHKIKMVYTTPLHQYPTTVSLSPRRRQSLIQLAEKHSMIILEDDYDHEFHYQGSPATPLSTETEFGIYVCSFSKILFPGGRLGIIACDQSIKNNLSYQKFLVSRQTDCLAQLGLSAWIKDGGFEKHLRRSCRVYESRYYFMLEQLEKLKLDSNIDWCAPQGGMSFWVNLNQDSKRIAEQAKKENIFFQFESQMDYSNNKGTHLRLGFACVNEAEIKTGFEVLKKLLR